MDFSKLSKIQDEDREGQFGYVHGVSGPGKNKNMFWRHFVTKLNIQRNIYPIRSLFWLTDVGHEMDRL